MDALERFAALVYGPYFGRVDAAVVYLEEAHPTDGWMYGGVEHLLPQATELEQRLAAARILADRLVGLADAHNTQNSVSSCSPCVNTGAVGVKIVNPLETCSPHRCSLAL